MDPLLKSAAKNGDVKFLKEAVSLKTPDYFLTQVPYDEEDALGGNIFHLAAWNDQAEFFSEATNLLPKDVLKPLLLQKDDGLGYIPLHAAAVKSESNYNIVKRMKEIYATFENEKPWLVLDVADMTPLHKALSDDKENEASAIEILSMDAEFESCTFVDDDGNTPLYYALKNGFDQVSEQILKSPLSSTSIFRTKDVPSPFHLAPYTSENVLRLLFKKCGDEINKTDDHGHSVLHQWADKGDAGPCKLVLDGDDFGELKNKIFKELIYATENKSLETPLHMAARKKQSELAQILLRGYQQQVSIVEVENQESVSAERHPWKIKNKFGNTPLHSALYESSSHEELALEILSIDPLVSRIRNNKGESPFFLAVRSGCVRAVDEILRIEEPHFNLLHRNDGTTVLHCLPTCPEDTGKKLLAKYWWMINLADDNKKIALHKAKEANVPWLVNLLENPSRIQKEHFDWVAACKRGETPAVLAFIDNCEDLQKTCREENDTPLHHIKLPTSNDYQNFLKISSIAELKNATNHDGATPLHRALERKDMMLARTLLIDDGVKRNIVDHSGKTAMHLLAKLCKENPDWGRMCKQIKVNPYLKTSYIQSGANLDQIRNTLSVVAALLATITFAAGFTLPGGLDGTTGQALLAKRASFLVFLLADVYAMCTAMLVLFCLMWSMVSESDVALLLVDRSVFILMQSLYGTLLTFMSGIYTVIAHSTLWAAIVVFVMCSIIGVSANRTALHKVISTFVPAASTDKEDELQLLEEGSAGAFSAGHDTSRKVD